MVVEALLPVVPVGMVPVPGVVVIVPFGLVAPFGTLISVGEDGVVVPGVAVVVPGVVVVVPGIVHGLVLLIDPELPTVLLPVAVAVPEVVVAGAVVLIHGSVVVIPGVRTLEFVLVVVV